MSLVLLGAGSAGRYALRHLRERGIEPKVFADNHSGGEGAQVEGIHVWKPSTVQNVYPDATWVCCAISRPAATEIREQMKAMGVRTKPLWEFLPVCHGLPSIDVMAELVRLTSDIESERQVIDQYDFRKRPNYEFQRDPSPISELYFPDFIQRLKEDEVFVDCGACDGDTVKTFIEQWPKWKHITAFEPDRNNVGLLRAAYGGSPKISCVHYAVGEHNKSSVLFSAAGDYSSRILADSNDLSQGAVLDRVSVITIDDWSVTSPDFPTPTYIKMDIEGGEVEALWGARRTLKEHMPVLAICAYHTSDHLWEIPLLIHAIQPAYKLFFRRYAEGAFEIVWYAVPPERVK